MYVCGVRSSVRHNHIQTTFGADLEVVPRVQVPVDSSLKYLFNVAMIDSRNLTAVYKGTNVSFSLTTYQDCVADEGCQSQVSSLIVIT